MTQRSRARAKSPCSFGWPPVGLESESPLAGFVIKLVTWSHTSVLVQAEAPSPPRPQGGSFRLRFAQPITKPVLRLEQHKLYSMAKEWHKSTSLSHNPLDSSSNMGVSHSPSDSDLTSKTGEERNVLQSLGLSEPTWPDQINCAVLKSFLLPR